MDYTVIDIILGLNIMMTWKMSVLKGCGTLLVKSCFFAHGQICPLRAVLPASFWRDNFLHY
jgi:hypothetical protein